MTILASLAGAALPGSLDAEITGFRSAKGQVLACLTTRPDRFPDCQRDPEARRFTLPTAHAAELRFADLPSGQYALALIHDENGNGKLDTLMGIPREGFGFSRNPAIRFGPPKFAEARVTVTAGTADENVRMKYLF
ncbi:MAG: DUF2141 domain-containing protein [Sphingomonadaceae bacterium]